MRTTQFKWFAIFSLMLFWPILLFAEEPIPYSAEYQATALGMTSTATRTLQQQEAQVFTLTNSMEVKVAGATLAAVEEYSQFQWINERLQPETYSYTQSGLSRKREQVQFDWNNAMATSTEDDDTWQLDLVPGVADNLSYQFLLRQELKRNNGEVIQLQVIDTDEIENHLYRITGQEVLETSAGSFNTVKVERVRENPRGRSTIFWLASDWDMLLVRFLQTESSGTNTELILQKATLGGQTVTPLP